MTEDPVVDGTNMRFIKVGQQADHRFGWQEAAYVTFKESKGSSSRQDSVTVAGSRQMFQRFIYNQAGGNRFRFNHHVLIGGNQTFEISESFIMDETNNFADSVSRAKPRHGNDHRRRDSERKMPVSRTASRFCGSVTMPHARVNTQ